MNGGTAAKKSSATAAFGRTYFEKSRAEDFDRALTKLCEPLEIWLDEHRAPERPTTHCCSCTLISEPGCGWQTRLTTTLFCRCQPSAARFAPLCSAWTPVTSWRADFAKGRAAVLFSATLAPAGYYKDLCGLPDARAVALRSPFDPANMGAVVRPAGQHPLQGPGRQHCQSVGSAGRDGRCTAWALPGLLPQLQLLATGVGGFHRPLSGPAHPLPGILHGRGPAHGVSGAVLGAGRKAPCSGLPCWAASLARA